MPYSDNDSLRSITFEEARVSAEKEHVKLRTVVYLLVMDSGYLLNFCYRISHRLTGRYRRHLLAELLPKAIMQFARVVTGSLISPKAKIGKRLKIAYGMNIVIGEYAEVGDDVFMFNGITLGSAMPGRSHVKQPRIGNRVLIGSGAKILGDIEIGDDVLIGANSVVLSSFGPNVTIAGIPARVVRDHRQET